MKILQKIREWLTKDPIKEGWDKHGSPLTKVRFEFEDGSYRQLYGKAADDWGYDFYLSINGRKVDWKKHKFEIHKIK